MNYFVPENRELIFESKECFRCPRSEVLTAFCENAFCETKSRARKVCTCQLFIQSILQATQGSIYLLDVMMDIRVSG